MRLQLCTLTCQPQTICQAHIFFKTKRFFFSILLLHNPRNITKNQGRLSENVVVSIVLDCNSLCIIVCDHNTIYVYHHKYSLSLKLMKENRVILLGIRKIKLLNNWCKMSESGSWWLCQPVQGFHFTHFLILSLSNKPGRLIHIYLFVKNAIKEHILDI